MMKKAVGISLGLGALVLSGTAGAANYAGANLAFVDYSTGGGDASLTALYGRLGTEFTPYFSGEIRLGTGIDDDNLGPVEIELEHLIGAYVRGGLPVGELFFPYAVLGFTDVEVEATGFGVSRDDSESDISFGVGVDIHLSPRVDINLEYMDWLDEDGADIDGIALGFAMKF